MTIFNTDGSVYMALPTAVPSHGDLEGWTVRHVSSGSHSTACRHPQCFGTFSLVRTDIESFNTVLKMVGAFADLYGYQPQSSMIKPDTFRWTFEVDCHDGHRGSDMIIVSRIH